MQYALLIYGSTRDEAQPGAVGGDVAEVLARPTVTGWARLHAAGSASTVRDNGLLIDGPFIETKEHLAGLVIVEADDLDAALAVAHDLQATRSGGAIEVRPIFEGIFGGV